MTKRELQCYRQGLLAAARMAQAELAFWVRAEKAAPNVGSVEACRHAQSAMAKFREEIRARAWELLKR